MSRDSSIQNILSQLNPLNGENWSAFAQGFQDDYGIGREDMQTVFYETREGTKDSKGNRLTKEAPRMESLLGTNQLITRTKELLGQTTDARNEALRSQDMQLRKDKGAAHVAGQLTGTLANDLTHDTSRGLWWLINALQAVGEIANEQTLNAFVPELYKSEPVRANSVDPKHKGAVKPGEQYILINNKTHLEEAINLGYIKDDDKKTPKRGYKWEKNASTGQTRLVKQNYRPGLIGALSIPTGLAINNGLGLLTPLGGAEGFKAAMPSEDDPTKTNNVVGEIAMKYILGRTGGILPYDEFKKVRPDVSLSEYKAYQADKFDNREDWNPFDGDFSIFGGALKGNVEGILGPELSMLGRSLPVNTGLVPAIAAIGGTALGARIGHDNGKRAIMGGLIGGLTGVVGGNIGGSIIENERRRRNGIENGELPLS